MLVGGLSGSQYILDDLVEEFDTQEHMGYPVNVVTPVDNS